MVMSRFESFIRDLSFLLCEIRLTSHLTEECLKINEYLDTQNIVIDTKDIKFETQSIINLCNYLILEFRDIPKEIKVSLKNISVYYGAILRSEYRDNINGLYVIIDPEFTNDRDPMIIAKAAINGGASVLQLRDKKSDKGNILELAHCLNDLCLSNGVELIINDHADIAFAVKCFGLHVGQTDLSVEASRDVLSPHQHIGRSNREFDQLENSQKLDIDHLAFGPVFGTSTKAIIREPQGIERLKEAYGIANLPLVAIGGINQENISSVAAIGIKSICVTSAVGTANDPERACSELVKAMKLEN